MTPKGIPIFGKYVTKSADVSVTFLPAELVPFPSIPPAIVLVIFSDPGNEKPGILLNGFALKQKDVKNKILSAKMQTLNEYPSISIVFIYSDSKKSIFTMQSSASN